MSFSPLLAFDISAGSVGILSGAAMSFRKSSPRHALAGKVFVISMLTMAATAVYLAVMKHQTGKVLGGAFTFYLVATAWVTARRKDGETRVFDWLALIGIALWISGVGAVRHQMWSENGVRVGMNFFMGSVLLLAAAGDVRLMVPGGLFGARRITRHLWHMCFALFIATGLSSWDRATSISVFNRTIKSTFCPGAPATAIADFLAIPSLLQKCIPEETDKAWR
jgi:hypothetical protein